jgi:hypothetical protein
LEIGEVLLIVDLIVDSTVDSAIGIAINDRSTFATGGRQSIRNPPSAIHPDPDCGLMSLARCR